MNIVIIINYKERMIKNIIQMVWLLIAAFCVVKTTLNVEEMLQVI